MKYPKPKRKDGLYICAECGKEYKSHGGYSNHWRKTHYETVVENTKDIVKDKYGLTPKQLEKVLVAQKSTAIKPLKVNPGKKYKFAAVGDTHLCSKEERLDALNAFYDMCVKEGVTDVYNAGDLIAGQGVYRGQEYEIHTFGADNQVRYFVENYPRRKGITTHFVTGNHDYIYYKQIGLDVGRMIDQCRDDMNYLGVFQADIMYEGIPLIRLIHPDGGMAYAMSYRMQKYVEQISSSKKPRIIISGHQHTAVWFFYRNIYVVQAGAFEGQTMLILRKGINPTIGGWIIEIQLSDDKHKSIISFKPDFRILEY